MAWIRTEQQKPLIGQEVLIGFIDFATGGTPLVRVGYLTESGSWIEVGGKNLGYASPPPLWMPFPKFHVAERLALMSSGEFSRIFQETADQWIEAAWQKRQFIAFVACCALGVGLSVMAISDFLEPYTRHSAPYEAMFAALLLVLAWQWGSGKNK
jgi:hypothetical protein